jgi:hypothetical protein
MAQVAEIIEITAPDEAGTGDRVDVIVAVKNLHSTDTVRIMAVGVPEYPGLPPGEYINGLYPYQAKLDLYPGWTGYFNGYFTMPESSVTIRTYSYWYGPDGLFHLDDEKSKVVKLTEQVQGFSELAVAGFQKG